MFRYPLTCKSEWDKILFEKRGNLLCLHHTQSLWHLHHTYLQLWFYVSKNIQRHRDPAIWKKYYHIANYNFYVTYSQDLSFIKIRIWRLSKPPFYNSLLMFDGHWIFLISGFDEKEMSEIIQIFSQLVYNTLNFHIQRKLYDGTYLSYIWFCGYLVFIQSYEYLIDLYNS